MVLADRDILGLAGGRVARATAIRTSASVALSSPRVAHTFQCKVLPAILTRGGRRPQQPTGLAAQRSQPSGLQGRAKSAGMASVGCSTRVIIAPMGDRSRKPATDRCSGSEQAASTVHDPDADYLWQVVLGCAPFMFVTTNNASCPRGVFDRSESNAECAMVDGEAVTAEGLGSLSSSAQRILTLIHRVGLRDGGVVTSKRFKHILQAQVAIDGQL